MSKPTRVGNIGQCPPTLPPMASFKVFLVPPPPNRMALLNALMALSLKKVLLSWYTPIYQSNFGKMPFTQRPKHKGYCCYHIPSATTYIIRHVIFYETNFPYSTMSSMPNDSSVLPQPATLPLHLLQHANRVTPMSSSLPHSNEPLPTSPPISAQPSPTTSHTVSSTPPSHPTTDQPPPSPSPSPVEPYSRAPSYYRVAANSEHTMPPNTHLPLPFSHCCAKRYLPGRFQLVALDLYLLDNCIQWQCII
ncbi:hypothetical protein V2J09_011413 [Rumex salicifolius]